MLKNAVGIFTSSGDRWGNLILDNGLIGNAFPTADLIGRQEWAGDSVAGVAGSFLRLLQMVVVGVIINRWNTTLSGLVAPPDWSPGVLGTGAVASYLPSITEIAVGLGILAYALAMFTLGVKCLPVFREISEGE